MNSEEKAEIMRYLCATYSGVFSEEQVQKHIEDYVEFGFASQMVEWVFASMEKIERLLDIGCGFGAFVLLCRKNGVDAVGIELAEFEVEYARRRLKEERPGDDPDYVYRRGNALELPFSANHFDAVTLWNVLEHIADDDRLLEEVGRVLRPGGNVYIICPNYAAFRKEAHYLVPWIPFLPTALAKFYLRGFGKEPVFFERNIFYRTNWGVLRAVRKKGFRLHIQEQEFHRKKLADPQKIQDDRTRYLIIAAKKYGLLWIVSLVLRMSSLKTYLRLYNPFKNSVILHLKKMEAD